MILTECHKSPIDGLGVGFKEKKGGKLWVCP